MDNKNVQFVNQSKVDSSAISGILSARAENKIYQETVLQDFADINKQLDAFNKATSDTVRNSKAMSEALRMQADLQKQIESKTVDTAEAYKTMVELNKKLIQLEQASYKEKIKNANNNEAAIRKLKKLQTESLQDLHANVAEYTRALEVNKAAQESTLKAVSSTLNKIKTDAKDMAIVSSLQGISNILGGNYTATANSVTQQFGISRTQFDTFKRDLLQQLSITGNAFKFGWKDTVDYLSNLDKLGITTTEMAEEQYLAILQGTKYLGQSVETQAAILKNARRSGNMNLLNETNQSIVKILNAQLGVSKAQLDQITNQAASLSQITSLGGIEATTNFQQQLSAIASKYGTDASTALSNIATSMLNGDTSYAAYLGTDYQRIMGKLQSGDSTALLDLYQSIQGSRYGNTQAGNAYLRGDMNSNVMTILSSGSQNEKSLATLMGDIQAADDNVDKHLLDIKQSFDEVVGNFISNVAAYLLPSWFDLANASYILQGLYYTTQFPTAMASILAAINKTTIETELLNTKSGKILSMFGKFNGGGLAGSIAGLAGTISLLAGTVIAINDTVNAVNKAEEWGTSKTAAGIGGFLGGTDSGMKGLGKGAAKGALIGGGIGLIFGGPIGGLIGAVIGGLAGAALGYAGGENIAKFIEGGSKATSNSHAEGDDSGMTFGSIPYAGDDSAKYSSNWAWGVASQWGPRKPIKTNNGATTSSFHGGIDLKSGNGKGIGANHGGYVQHNFYDKSGGNMLIVAADNGLYERYCHMIAPSHKQRGDRVEAGELIGYTGATGGVTGPHLHFGVYRGSSKSTSVDPSPYITPALFAQRNNVFGGQIGPAQLDTWYSTNPENSDNIDQNTGSLLLSKIVSSDTLSDAASAINFAAAGDDNSTTEAVNTGFSNLIEKIDSLAHRQDEQEEMLKAISSGTTSALYRF